MDVTSITLYSLILVCDFIGLCTTFFLFIIMFLRRSVMKTDRISYLLTLNIYLTIITSIPFFTEMCIRSIYGKLHPDSFFDEWTCPLKASTFYINGGVYFFSFFLQSVFRFCRIVHPRRPALQSFRSYAILSAGLWILSPLLMLPSYFLGHLEYLPNDYHCQFSPTSIFGTLLGSSLVFLIPFISTLICYFYTMYYVRTQTTALVTINRYRGVRRDLIILTRLVVLFTIICTNALPHVIIPIAYNITGYIPPWSVPFEWLLTSFSLTAAGIIQIFTTPYLKKLFIRTNRINPATRLNPLLINNIENRTMGTQNNI